MGSYRKGDSVKTLLGPRGGPALARVTEQAKRQAAWRPWLQAHLAADVMAHVCGIVEKDDTLIVFTESAPWSARMRYAVGEIEGTLRHEHPQIRAVTVRVMPKV